MQHADVVLSDIVDSYSGSDPEELSRLLAEAAMTRFERAFDSKYCDALIAVCRGLFYAEDSNKLRRADLHRAGTGSIKYEFSDKACGLCRYRLRRALSSGTNCPGVGYTPRVTTKEEKS